MKKLFAVIIALAMLLTVAAFADAADIAGDWYLTEIVMSGTSMSPGDLGMSMSITLNADGSAEAVAVIPGQGENKASGTWDVNGDVVTLTLDGSPQDFTYADGKLSAANVGGVDMILTKDAPAGEAYAPAAAKGDAAIDEYVDRWVAVKVGAQGTYVPAEMLGSMLGGEVGNFVLDVTESTIKMSGFLFGDALPELPVTFEDGALKLEIEGQVSIVCQLLEDDTMSVAMSASGQSFEFIMERAAQ